MSDQPCERLCCHLARPHHTNECHQAPVTPVPDPVTQARRAVDPLAFLTDEDGAA